MEPKRIYVTQIKQNNMNLVKSALRRDGSGTKLSVSASTGLSVSTCNTLLNHLLSTGELIEAPNPYNRIGRPAKAYEINPDYAHAGCILLLENHGLRTIVSTIFNFHGDTLYKAKEVVPVLDAALLEHTIAALKQQDSKISSIAVGIPGIVNKSRYVTSCDIEELANWEVSPTLEQAIGCDILVENDMNAIVYGLGATCTEAAPGPLVVANFVTGICPGCGILIDGAIVRGKSNFAGEISYLFSKDSRKTQINKLSDDGQQLPLLCSLLLSVITVLNPSQIYITGDVITEPLLQQIQTACLQFVDAEHLPQFELLGDSTPYYQQGLWNLALNQAEFGR